jgi:hypothetical protein
MDMYLNLRRTIQTLLILHLNSIQHMLTWNNKRNYGMILRGLSGLSTQYSLGNDQYPKSIADAKNVLSNHKFDANYNNSNNQRD